MLIKSPGFDKILHKKNCTKFKLNDLNKTQKFRCLYKKWTKNENTSVEMACLLVIQIDIKSVCSKSMTLYLQGHWHIMCKQRAKYKKWSLKSITYKEKKQDDFE